MSELVKRISVALVGIPLFIGMLYMGEWWFTAFVTLISLGALIEYYNMEKHKDAQAVKRPSIAIGALLPISFYYSLVNISATASFAIVIALLFAIPALSLIFEIFSGRKNSVLNFSASLSGIFYISLPMVSMIMLRNFNGVTSIFPEGTYSYFASWAYSDFAWLVLLVLSAIWICDSAAYFGGMAMGKHKLFERVSPKKTWEGALWGFVGAVAGSYFLGEAILPEHPSFLTIIIGIVAGVFGQIGDLGESLLKRDAGIKDSSNFFPGHGGFLDRFDSVLFVFPILTAALILFGYFL